MSRKKIALFIVVFLAVPVAALAGIFLLIQSPLAVNALAAFIEPVTGISLHVDDISLNRHLDASVNGLHIRTVKANGFAMTLAKADINTDVGPGLYVEVEKILLTGPKFTFHMKNDKTDPFAVLKKIPPVRLLEVKNGQLELKSDLSVYSLPGLDLTIRDFEPDGGGKLNGKSQFNIRSKGVAGKGILVMTLDVSRFSPQPSGSGSFHLSFDSGSFGDMKLDDMKMTTGLTLDDSVISLDGAKASILSLSHGEGSEGIIIRDTQTQFNGSYNQKTSAFALTSLDGSGAGIGLLKGRASGTLTPLTWGLSLHASSLDLAQVFGLVRPLLPETYRDWTFKGNGGLEVESEGWTADGSTAWNASVIANLSEGSFASADSSKAGEQITGRIELRLGSPDKGRKGSFNVTMEGRDGEFLWDEYYQNFQGKSVSVVSQGTFAQNPFSLSSAGTLDLFQTGDYRFSADKSDDHSVFSLDAKGIACQRLFNILMRNYVNQNYPTMHDMTLDGELDLTVTASISQQQQMIEGNFALRDGELRSLSNRLMLTGLNISLPYDLALKGTPSLAPSSTTKEGFVAFNMFEKGDTRIDKFETPVVLSGNRLLMPDPIDFVLFGGEVRLTGFRVENLLSPEMRVVTGMTVKQLSLGDLIVQASSILLPGTIDGEFSSIVFHDGQWSTQGKVVAQIFNGRVAIENLFAGRLFSSSRFFGADAVFDGIDLEAVTEKIKVGQMTGLIKGSLKNFMMEYGQPARFDLVITSDKSSKVAQQISVDAINNLSIISTGSGAVSAILSTGVNRFFKEYPYRDIGIRCSLADDIFSLRGLIHDGGIEYLVRKTWLRGIDIVNQNPDNSISFKDMAERVERIFQPRPESKNVSQRHSRAIVISKTT